jgi:hypothetical protein
MNVTDENRDPSYWEVPGKELDQLIRKWVIKRQWEEDLQRYETLSQTLKL